jgi:hypothetical protein
MTGLSEKERPTMNAKNEYTPEQVEAARVAADEAMAREAITTRNDAAQIRRVWAETFSRVLDDPIGVTPATPPTPLAARIPERAGLGLTDEGEVVVRYPWGRVVRISLEGPEYTTTIYERDADGQPSYETARVIAEREYRGLVEQVRAAATEVARYKRAARAAEQAHDAIRDERTDLSEVANKALNDAERARKAHKKATDHVSELVRERNKLRSELAASNRQRDEAIDRRRAASALKAELEDKVEQLRDKLLETKGKLRIFEAEVVAPVPSVESLADAAKRAYLPAPHGTGWDAVARAVQDVYRRAAEEGPRPENPFRDASTPARYAHDGIDARPENRYDNGGPLPDGWASAGFTDADNPPEGAWYAHRPTSFVREQDEPIPWYARSSMAVWDGHTYRRHFGL